MNSYSAAPGALLHVKILDPWRRPRREIVVEPMVPLTGLGGEDKNTPRVCLAPTLGGCLAAIEAWSRLGPGDDQIVVYWNADPIEVLVPSRRLVPDAPETGEVWSLEPTRLRLVPVADPDGLRRAVDDVLNSLGDLTIDADAAFGMKAALADAMLGVEEDFLGRTFTGNPDTRHTNPYYHGSKTPLAIGTIIRPKSDGYVQRQYADGFEDNWVERAMEAGRPKGKLSRLKSVFMLKLDGDRAGDDGFLYEHAGGYGDYVYEVEPIGTVESSDLRWYTAAAYPRTELGRKRAINAYWRGKPAGHQMEHRAPAARVLRLVGGSAVTGMRH